MNHDMVLQLVDTIMADVAPASKNYRVERVLEGVSTEVYRIHSPAATYYLRLLPELDASFAPEVGVHRRLVAQGVHVPAVLFFEHYDALLQRSVMLTTEIPGSALGSSSQPPARSTILRQAGRELAQIGQIQVAGFGWIDRSIANIDILRAEQLSFAAWIEAEIDQACSTLATAQYFSALALTKIRAAASALIDQVGDAPAILAHGDFDVSHIYHQAGVYSGIIDFGEIRGTNLLYDLGHFQLENPELLPDLLDGYREVRALPRDAMHEIMRTGLLIAVSRLARATAKGKKLHPPYMTAVTRTLEWLAA